MGICLALMAKGVKRESRHRVGRMFNRVLVVYKNILNTILKLIQGSQNGIPDPGLRIFSNPLENILNTILKLL